MSLLAWYAFYLQQEIFIWSTRERHFKNQIILLKKSKAHLWFAILKEL